MGLAKSNNIRSAKSNDTDLKKYDNIEPVKSNIKPGKINNKKLAKVKI